MFNHTLKLALRNFVRDKQFALLNLLGLSLGTAAFFLAIQYASFEMSYDAFHEEADNIFRVAHLEKDGNHTYEGVGSFYGIGPKALEEFPEVKNFTRLHRADGMVSWANPKGAPVSYHEINAYYADKSFFDIFSFPLIQGSRRDLLNNPNSVLISESAAKKYFGDKDPMGEVLSLTTEWKGGNYTVEGVFTDVPTNSHLSFDFIFPITELLTNFQFKGKDWYWINFYTYLLLEPGADVAGLSTGLTQAVDRHIHFLFQTEDYEFNLALQPVTDINLHSDLDGEIKETGKWPSIKAFVIAAFFTIVLAWLNYINLTTARATRRAKEIGLKKVMGSSKSALVGQFLLESMITNVIAVVIALGLLVAFFPAIERWFGIALQFDWGLQYPYWLVFAGLFVAGTIGSSLYPAYHLSSLKIVHSLKGQISDRGRSGLLRKGMMMTQFALSLLLLTGSLVIYEQIGLMKSRDLGMDISNKLVIKAPRETKTGYWRSLRNFKEEVLKRSTFAQATISFEVPGRDIFWGAGFTVDGLEETVIVSRTQFDYDFIPSYQIKLLAGKNFEDRFEGAVVIINEAASKLMGFESPEQAIGQKINDGWQERRIIGVMDNYHHQSPRFKVRPLVASPFSKEHGFITLSMTPGNYTAALREAEEVYHQLFAGNAFESFFLQDYFDEQYQSDNQFMKLLVTFTGLSIFISILGLIGFASFVSMSRMKEVGIRKVLGASSRSILMLFNREISKLIALSFLVASPVVYWLADGWLENYANRVSLSPAYFLVPMLAILVMATLTLSAHLIRLSRSNPVNLVRIE